MSGRTVRARLVVPPASSEILGGGLCIGRFNRSDTASPRLDRLVAMLKNHIDGRGQSVDPRIQCGRDSSLFPPTEMDFG